MPRPLRAAPEAGGISAPLPLDPLRRAAGAFTGGGATYAVVVSPEIGTDAPVYGPATQMQLDAAIAFDGTQYLAAWSDYRAGDAQAYATRVDASGAVLDPAGIRLGNGKVMGVAQGGGVFLVLYRSETNPGSILRGAIVGPSGAISADVNISHQIEFAGIGVVFDGTQFMTVWSSDGQVLYARVTPAGVVLDPGGAVILGGSYPSIATDGTHSLLVYRGDTSKVMGARMTPQATLLDPAGFDISASAGWVPDVSFDGTNYVVGWSDEVANSQRIVAARVSSQGAVLDAGGIVLHEDTDPDYATEPPRLVSDGASTLVLWSRYVYDNWTEETRFVRLSPQGTLLTPTPVMLTAMGGMGDGVASGNDVFLVWNAQRPPVDRSILGSRLSPQNALLDNPPVFISQSANGQVDPAAAFDGQNFVVTWSDDRAAAQGGLWDIRATRISLTGQNVDATSLAVHTSQWNWLGRPRASFDGLNTVLTWWSCDAFIGDGDWWCNGAAARLSPQGALLDPTPAVIWFDDVHLPYPMGISSGQGSTFIAGRTMAEVLNVGFLSQAGAASGITSVTGGFGTIPRAPASAFDGDHHLLVWSEDRFGTGEWDIYGTRVTSAGALVDGEGVPLAPSAMNIVSEVAIAWNGSHYLLVWREGVYGASSIRAQRFTPQLQVLDAQPIDVADHPNCTAVALDSKGVVWDGQRWVLAWRACGPNSVDVLGAEISDAGVVLSSYPITADAFPDGTPSLATDGNGVTLAAYASAREAPFGTSRVFARVLEEPGGSGTGDAGGMGAGGAGGSGAGGSGAGGNAMGAGGMGAGGTGGMGPVDTGEATSTGAGGNDVPSESCSATGGQSSGPTWAPLLLAFAWGALRYRRR